MFGTYPLLFGSLEFTKSKQDVTLSAGGRLKVKGGRHPPRTEVPSPHVNGCYQGWQTSELARQVWVKQASEARQTGVLLGLASLELLI